MEIVTIKKEYCDTNESPNTRYFVVEDNGDRIIISPCECNLPIVPRELVRRAMVTTHGKVEV